MRTRWREGVGASLIWAAPAPLVPAWLSYVLRESAIAAVADVTLLGAVLAGLALALVAAGLLLRRGRGGTLTRAVGVAGAAGAVPVLLLLLGFRIVAPTAEDVRFPSGDFLLAGVLHLPHGPPPHPAVVLVHGSGPESRSPYTFYASYLARRGIAAIAYDKRGVGESEGELYGDGYGDYAEDVLAAARALIRDPRVDPGKIGLVGFSEAEWVAPLAASRSSEIAFLALVGASGMRPSEQVATEMAIRLRQLGHSERVVEQALALNEQLLAFQRTGEGREELNVSLRRARSEPWFSDAEDLPEEVRPSNEYPWMPWWRSVMDFDPVPAWEAIRVPVLLLKGGRDGRSPAGTMRDRIVGALDRAGNQAVHVRIFPHADHMLLEWPRGEGNPPPVFADGYLGGLVEWIERVTTGGGPPIPDRAHSSPGHLWPNQPAWR